MVHDVDWPYRYCERVTLLMELKKIPYTMRKENMRWYVAVESHSSFG
jgi:hypothetical protein